MAERYILVLDAGTTKIRLFVFDSRGEIAASGSTEWVYRSVPDASSFACEFDAGATWSAVCALIRAVLDAPRVSGGEFEAVTATSQRQGVVFLDRDGGEVYSGPNLDLRAVFEGGAIDEQLGDRVYETTGHTPSFLFAPARLRWFQLNRPAAYARIASVVTLADWLLFRLSGVLVSEPTLAAEAGLLDIRTRLWCADLMADLGVVDNSHVALMDAGSVNGQVSEGASSETGIAAATPVVVAGADTQCGLLGMGVREPGQVGVVAGWSLPLQMVTSAPVLSPDRRTWAGVHLSRDRWVLESTSGDAGNSYRWLRGTLWGTDERFYAEMDAAAGRVPAGSEGAMAFLGAGRMDMGRAGMGQGGLMFPVPLTFSEFGRGHMARAALEATAYAVRTNLEQAEELAGSGATDIAVGGGMTRTATWVDILANALGRPIRVSAVPEVSAVGAYLCAATAMGRFATLTESADSAAGRLTALEPDARDSAEYEEHYQRWLEVQAKLQRLEG